MCADDVLHLDAIHASVVGHRSLALDTEPSGVIKVAWAHVKNSPASPVGIESNDCFQSYKRALEVDIFQLDRSRTYLSLKDGRILYCDTNYVILLW